MPGASMNFWAGSSCASSDSISRCIASSPRQRLFKERCASAHFPLEREVVDLLDLLPALRRHTVPQLSFQSRNILSLHSVLQSGGPVEHHSERLVAFNRLGNDELLAV